MTISGAEAEAMGLPTLGALESGGGPSAEELERRYDPQVNPALANAAAAAFQAAGREQAPPPVPPEPEDDTFDLPGGYVDRKGVLHTWCRVRDLNGEDEEELARPAARRTPSHLVDTIVKRCTVQIGPYMVGKDLPVEELDNLLVGDRDMIALVVRRLTYGTELPLSDVACPSCGKRFDVTYDLVGDVPIRKLTGDASKQQREVELPDLRGLGPGTAVVRLVTGGVQKAVVEADSANTMSGAEITTLILRESVDLFRGRPVNGVRDVLAWKARDRQAVRKYLEENTCGPRYEEVTQDCPQCHGSFPLVIDLGVLFP